MRRGWQQGFYFKGRRGRRKHDVWELRSAAVKYLRSGDSSNASPWRAQCRWLRPSLEASGSAVRVRKARDFSDTLGWLASVAAAECPIANNTGQDRSVLFPY